jgi:hypothetical protein
VSDTDGRHDTDADTDADTDDGWATPTAVVVAVMRIAARD